MSKTSTKATTSGAQQALLDADLELRSVADEHGNADMDDADIIGRLRDAALAFAAAWHACGASIR